ncbi:ModD protein [Roseospirillum parvum]|uniref:Putative pyrophosphorylase ModD n=1 Tax=Roseospirillum parvum TaxID=83401 RepID=A0A1G8CN87_9PROT|nr:ModD protein [Roseospirillum parvum]SDH46834.1 molybdenum transport protein [Roseospirillum parvum]
MGPRLSDSVLERLLAEDLPLGDLTTRALGIGRRPGRLSMAARDPLVLAGLDPAARLFGLLGAHVERRAMDGDRLAPGDPILAVEGPAEALHGAWKVAQTVLETSAGMATVAADMVAAARAVNPRARIACTRKTPPGGRALAVAAILAGGADPHRLGLSETVLVFAEHRAFLDPGKPLAEWLGALKAACPEKRVVVEVTDADDAEAVARAGADVVQLEKFPPPAVARVVARLAEVAPATVVAAAGGIGPGNAADFARAGATVLVTSTPYRAAPRDVQVHLQPA